jgi:RNA-binding protein
MRALTPEQRKYLKAQAHVLKPVVMIGTQGLTEAVVKESERALAAHELIKIRVLGDDRAVREQHLETLCATLDAAPVQHIGKLLLLYRPADKPKLRLP